ncbi:MAG: hypothetical protein CBC55_02830 [Gammaproteobacteria bacterium TMED95]|nr:MAG: hypothetical protein CBC55_02830 [Gammaproteobacteria bacterium TMED95]|tara:strand:+ start:4406 stop:5221 length:816 start_codon:yes stop_codon:yes gene_type:complete
MMTMRKTLITALMLTPFVAQAELVARWDFDSVNDGVFSDRTNTHSGSTDATSVDGILGDALYFDGTQLATITFPYFPTGDFTVSFWADIDVTIDQGLFSLENDTGTSHDRHIGVINNDGYARIWNRESVEAKSKPNYEGDEPIQETYFTIPNDYGDTQWHQWVLTVEKGVGTSIYIDGYLVSQRTDIDYSAFDWSENILLGFSRDVARLNQETEGDLSGGFAIGAIDELAIYDTGMTQAEVMALNDVPSPLVGLFSLTGIALLLSRKERRA